MNNQIEALEVARKRRFLIVSIAIHLIVILSLLYIDGVDLTAMFSSDVESTEVVLMP